MCIKKRESSFSTQGAFQGRYIFSLIQVVQGNRTSYQASPSKWRRLRQTRQRECTARIAHPLLKNNSQVPTRNFIPCRRSSQSYSRKWAPPTALISLAQNYSDMNFTSRFRTEQKLPVTEATSAGAVPI